MVERRGGGENATIGRNNDGHVLEAPAEGISTSPRAAYWTLAQNSGWERLKVEDKKGAKYPIAQREEKRRRSHRTPKRVSGFRTKRT